MSSSEIVEALAKYSTALEIKQMLELAEENMAWRILGKLEELFKEGKTLEEAIPIIKETYVEK